MSEVKGSALYKKTTMTQDNMQLKPEQDLPVPTLLMPCRVYGSIHSDGAGAVNIYWFASQDDANYDQDHLAEGWGERCTETIHTYEGSAEWLEAIENSINQHKERPD